MLGAGNEIKKPLINLGPKVSPSVPEARYVNTSLLYSVLDGVRKCAR